MSLPGHGNVTKDPLRIRIGANIFVVVCFSAIAAALLGVGALVAKAGQCAEDPRCAATSVSPDDPDGGEYYTGRPGRR